MRDIRYPNTSWCKWVSSHENCPYCPCTSVRAKSLQSRLTLCDPMDHSLPGSSVHGILQARILEWVVISSSRGFSQTRDQTHIYYISWTGRWGLYHQCHLGIPRSTTGSSNSPPRIYPGKTTSWKDTYTLTSQVAQSVKRLPPMWKTQVQSLGREDPLEKEMAPHSSTLAWKIPWMEEPGRLQSMGLQKVGHDWATSSSSDVNSSTIGNR